MPKKHSPELSFHSWINQVASGPSLAGCRLWDKMTQGRTSVADKKVVFVAFAIEDETQRDFLKGQSLHPRAPFEFIDMSVKQAYDSDWQSKVRTRIRRSDGVIALISKNSLTSTGQKWEIQCAKDEGKPVRGIWAYSDDRTNVAGVATTVWSDKNVSDFIDSL
jgi:hypothetical protein